MIASLCRVRYTRPDGSVITCTYLDGHPIERHSWFTVQVQDEADAEAAVIDYTPTAVQALLDGMAEGQLDAYLEAILAVGHTRKRTLRGVQHTFHLKGASNE